MPVGQATKNCARGLRNERLIILQIEFDLRQSKKVGGYFALLQPANFIVEYKLRVFIPSFFIYDFKNACIHNVAYDRTCSVLLPRVDSV